MREGYDEMTGWLWQKLAVPFVPEMKQKSRYLLESVTMFTKGANSPFALLLFLQDEGRKEMGKR
jgi:hypothetical protein